MTGIAHPDGRPWRYWLREDGGWWVVVPDEPMPHVLGHVECHGPARWLAVPWQWEGGEPHATMHLAAQAMFAEHGPAPEALLPPLAGPQLPDALEVF